MWVPEGISERPTPRGWGGLCCSAEIEQTCLLSADADYKSLLWVFKKGYEDRVFWFLTRPQTVCTESEVLLSNTSGCHRKITVSHFIFQKNNGPVLHTRQQQVWQKGRKTTAIFTAWSRSTEEVQWFELKLRNCKWTTVIMLPKTQPDTFFTILFCWITATAEHIMSSTLLIKIVQLWCFV